jgi:cardiolipin synthase
MLFMALLSPQPWREGTRAGRLDRQRENGRRALNQLRQASPDIYKYQPSMVHCKVMIIGRLMTSVGSANFDNQSSSLKCEVHLNIYSAGFAKRPAEAFEQDLLKSHRITLQECEARPPKEKLHEKLAKVMSSQLALSLFKLKETRKTSMPL